MLYRFKELIGPRLIVLGYHSISDNPSDIYTVRPDTFAAQIRWLTNHGYTVMPLKESIDYLRTGKVARKYVVLTFDDAYHDFLDNAVPTLLHHQVPATLFVVAGQVGKLSQWHNPGRWRKLLTWKEVKEVVALGFEIGGHSMNHPDLTTVSDHKLQAEVTMSREILQEKLGESIDGFAYPEGAYGLREVKAVRKAEYQYAVTVDSGDNLPRTDIFRLKRRLVLGNESLEEFVLTLSMQSMWPRIRRQIAKKLLKYIRRDCR